MTKTEIQKSAASSFFLTFEIYLIMTVLLLPVATAVSVMIRDVHGWIEYLQESLVFTLYLPVRMSLAFHCCTWCYFISTVSLFVAACGKSEKQLIYSSTSLFLFRPRLSPHGLFQPSRNW